MGSHGTAAATRAHQPIILIRGFGGLDVEDEKRIAYQGFNDGTVYPHKRGENYIYEGLILRFMKSRWSYQDATNVVGYYSKEQGTPPAIPEALASLDRALFAGDKVVIDPAMALALLTSKADPLCSLWVFRYYDLDDRKFEVYGAALVRLIDFIRALCALKTDALPKVNIIAHSMGGLLVREAIQRTYPKAKRDAREHINKIVTLGTPHQGISFQVLRNWVKIGAERELEHFNPDFQADSGRRESYVNFHQYFPPARLLTVVGTNYRTYGAKPASFANRLFSVDGEFGPTYNRSDGLVKQAMAQIPGAPRSFVHKCHGGPDSLVTSREAFEIATRFFFGDWHARLHLVSAEVTRGTDLVGKSEFFFGVSLKPRGVDFELFHQSAEAENCYGPFHEPDLSDKEPAFGWAGPGRLILETWFDTDARSPVTAAEQESPDDIVVRLDVYVGERDSWGIGFSDNVVFRKHYYLRAMLAPTFALELYTDESFRSGAAGTPMTRTAEGHWEFDIGGTGFRARLRVVLTPVPEIADRADEARVPA